MATSLDGKAAAARRLVAVDHRDEAARATSSACGRGPTRSSSASGTALADDPSLTVRDPRFAEARPPAARRRRRDGPRCRHRAAVRRLGADARRHHASSRRDARACGVDGRPAPRSRSASATRPAACRSGLAGRGTSASATSRACLLEGGPTLAWSAVADGARRPGGAVPGAAARRRRPRPGRWAGAGSRPIAERAAARARSVDRLGDDLRVEADVHRDR